MTWKVADGILQHIDIIEQGKENAFSLGKSLLINGEVSEYYIFFIFYKLALKDGTESRLEKAKS